MRRYTSRKGSGRVGCSPRDHGRFGSARTCAERAKWTRAKTRHSRFASVRSVPCFFRTAGRSIVSDLRISGARTNTSSASEPIRHTSLSETRSLGARVTWSPASVPLTLDGPSHRRAVSGRRQPRRFVTKAAYFGSGREVGRPHDGRTFTHLHSHYFPKSRGLWDATVLERPSADD